MAVQSPEFKEIVVQTTQTIGQIALDLYRDSVPANKLTPHKWLAVYIPNRHIDALWPDPNAIVEAGTTLQVPLAPPTQYPNLIDGAYYNAAFGFRVKLAPGWQVRERGETAVTFTHRSEPHHHAIKIVEGGPNLHYLIDEIMADMLPNETWDKLPHLLGMADAMQVSVPGKKKQFWFVAQYMVHTAQYHAFMLDFVGRDAGWLGDAFEVFSQYSALQVGQPAKIQVENSILNMRQVPGLNTAVLRMLPHETIVTVVAPPQNIDGYTWWQVCTDDQVYGWVVEAVDGINTLVPLA
ncbi:MAG: SH3 domain-containing protein [Chloroflexi bacterium]|nr:SH3 domain-containing protein [Chloroflexota bacterium]